MTQPSATSSNPASAVLFGSSTLTITAARLLSALPDGSLSLTTERFVEGLIDLAVDTRLEIVFFDPSTVDIEEAKMELLQTASSPLLVELNAEGWSQTTSDPDVFVLCLSGDLSIQVQSLTVTARRLEEMGRRHRAEKDEMIRQLIDLRDAQERVEAQGEDLVQMAENLEIAKRQLERLNLEKDKLFSIVAHDLRSPFNAILGYSELLMLSSKAFDVDQIETYARATHEGASRVFGMMENLLAWAKLQMEHTEFSPSDHAIRELFDQTIETYRMVASEKGVEIDAQLPTGTLTCDEGMLITIVRNLINNAVKFSHKQGVVRIMFEAHPDALPPAVTIGIADQGIGMTDEQISKLRAHGSLDSNHGTAGESGTGLGLNLCIDLLDRHGAALEVASSPGCGSRFSFTLPGRLEANGISGEAEREPVS